MTSEIAASIVLPSHGRRESLLRVLRALAQQQAPADTFEVVVICDGDVDGSAVACLELAQELPYALRVFQQTNLGPAATRNRGVELARAPLIIFLDDDVVPDEQLIAAHLAAQQGQEICVAIGPLLPPPDVRLNAWGAWEERTLCRQYDDMAAGRWQATYRQFYTGNASVLKRHVVDAGGFDPAFRRAEDVELALRLRDRGLHFVFLPEARGWHYVERSFDAWLRMPAAYGDADGVMARRRPELMGIIAAEYPNRNHMVRLANALCLRRPLVARFVIATLHLVAATANAFGVCWLAHLACSLIFNLRYYDALATSLGGRAAFWHRIRGGYAVNLPGYLPEQPPVDAG